MSRIDVVLRSARRRLRRLPAAEVPEALRRGAVLVDIRPQAQRFREGELPGALVIDLDHPNQSAAANGAPAAATASGNPQKK